MAERTPSINITKDKLQSILIDVLGISIDDQQMSRIMHKAFEVRLNTRSVKPTKANKKKLEKKSPPKPDLVKKLILCWTKLMIGKKPILSPIKGTALYGKYEQAVKAFEVFRDAFELDDSFLNQYLSLGMLQMNKNYDIGKFAHSTVQQRILDKYAILQAIAKDEYPEETEYLFSEYCKMTGIEKPEKFYREFWINFIHTSKLIIEHDTSPKQWVAAQFEYFKKLDGSPIPTPSQLHTPKAIIRWMEYSQKQKTSKKKNPNRL